jgi:hypothetical protein
MSRKIHQTVIPDDDGVDHDYTATTLPTEDGCRLALQIADVLSGAAGSALTAISGILRSVAGGKVTAAEAQALVSRDLDLSSLASLPGRLLTAGGPGLMRAMLAGVKRATTAEDGTRSAADVGKPDGFNDAFAANYGELARAISWVVEINYGPSWTALLAGGSSPSSQPAPSGAPKAGR